MEETDRLRKARAMRRAILGDAYVDRMTGDPDRLKPVLERFFLQPSAMGALPTLRAAVDPEARGGEYYGPDGWAEQRGHPVRVDSHPRARSRDDARRLWELSELATGVKYAF